MSERKPERLHQMQPRLRSQTEATNVARIRGNLRLNKDDVEHIEKLIWKPRSQEVVFDTCQPSLHFLDSCLPDFLICDDYLILLATNFSSLITSAANLRIPS